MQHDVLGNKINVYVAVTHEKATTSEEGIHDLYATTRRRTRSTHRHKISLAQNEC